MKVMCSWCQGEGRPALVREKDPLYDLRETHGICPEHAQELSRDVESCAMPAVAGR